jgi:1-pyrroline-5-carboxylate dehydrogenase
MSSDKSFELTYGSMFNPPEELHTRFESGLEKVKAGLGKEYSMWINGQERFSDQKFEDRSPIDTEMVLGIFQKGNSKDANDAVAAALKAFPEWSRMPWQERIALVRRAAELIDERIYEISAAMALEVGKNRMESLGDVAETSALMRYSCDQIEANNGFVTQMGEDPISGYDFVNVSVLRPYGVWLVISPFNFPAALSYGPTGAALAAGNTVVLKPATDTPWVPRLIADCIKDAGLPDGVFNFVTGPGGAVGQTLVDHADIAGATFTGSYDVGMGIYRTFSQGKWVRPIILELGGKNPAIVSRNADLDEAAIGIMRSAFGLQGQKCSANSRVFVEETVMDGLRERLLALTEKMVVGDPTKREVYFGPVINHSAYQDYQNYAEDLDQNGRILTGGKILTEGALSRGYFAAPTLVDNLPLDHRLWKQEMFLPITTLATIKSLEEGMRLANDVSYGLTAGFFGTPEEAAWFFENIEAGVVYANRPMGSTTGAWPGFQPFGGWKASGASGKNAGGHYYVQLYMHEQSRTLVKKK